MGYGFQPAESIPLSYISYQPVFPTPPYRSSQQWARLDSRGWFPILFRGSILSRPSKGETLSAPTLTASQNKLVSNMRSSWMARGSRSEFHRGTQIYRCIRQLSTTKRDRVNAVPPEYFW